MVSIERGYGVTWSPKCYYLTEYTSHIKTCILIILFLPSKWLTFNKINKQINTQNDLSTKF